MRVLTALAFALMTSTALAGELPRAGLRRERRHRHLAFEGQPGVGDQQDAVRFGIDPMVWNGDDGAAKARQRAGRLRAELPEGVVHHHLRDLNRMRAGVDHVDLKAVRQHADAVDGQVLDGRQVAGEHGQRINHGKEDQH